MLEGHCGRGVFFVMGVTDVDDKIIARARDRSVECGAILCVYRTRRCGRSAFGGRTQGYQLFIN